MSDAINLPAESSLTPENLLVPGPQTDMLNSYRGKIIVVMGSRNNRDQVTKVSKVYMATLKVYKPETYNIGSAKLLCNVNLYWHLCLSDFWASTMFHDYD